MKRPGLHLLSALQAVAHGADTVQYCQWRAGLGGTEKFHGAVLAHTGTENTRVFRDVSEVGDVLNKLKPVIGTSVQPEVALIYDWEVRWAIDGSAGPLKDNKDYLPECRKHYEPRKSSSLARSASELLFLGSLYVLSLGHEEHTETLRAFHQIGEGQRSDLIKPNQRIQNHFNKNSSAAKRLNCSL